jgi:proton glutamate symport protein
MLFGYYGKKHENIAVIVQAIAPLGKIYLSLLSMCIKPIIISAIISGVALLLQSSETKDIVKRLSYSFVGFVFIPSITGITIGLIGQPGLKISNQAKSSLGQMLSSANQGVSQNGSSFLDFLQNLIPENIFNALSQGQDLRIVLFSLLFGIALGTIKNEEGNMAVKITSAFYQSFIKIFSWLLTILPIGLFLIISNQILKIETSLFLTITIYVKYVLIGALILYIIYGLIISYSTKIGFFKVFYHLKTPLFLSFVADDSFISMPYSIEILKNKLNVPERMGKMIIPLGTVINRQGIIFAFSLLSIFLLQFYGMEITFEKIAIILLSSSLAGMVALGPAVTYSAMIAFVVEPIGIPLELSTIIIITASFIVDRVLSTIIVLANCALTAFSTKDFEFNR